MTQPDELFPAAAANYSSLAAWAAKTQADWEAEIYAAHESSWQDAVDGFTAILQQIPVVGDIIEVLSGVEDGDLNDLGTWVTNLLNDITDLQDRVQALEGGS